MSPAQIRLLPTGLLLAGLVSCDSSPVSPGDPNNQDIPTTCEPSNTIELAVGESTELQGNAAALLCVQARGGHASYLLVATSTAPPSASLSAFTFQAERTTLAVGSPFPVSAEPMRSPQASLAEGDLVEDIGFHVRMREAAEKELADSLVTGIGLSPSMPSFAPAAAPPAVGALLVLNAQSSGQACANPIQVIGRVQVVSSKAIVVSDTTNPIGGFSLSEYQGFANFFDQQIAPLTEEYFGEVTDIDNNGRTILLFTKEVNRLTPANSPSYIGGFFHPRDLRSKSECPTSNVAEILYLMAPDPTGTIHGNSRSAAFVQGITASTMVHEQQHLINASLRLSLSNNVRNEESWLNEGLSHLAEELLFYRMSERSPETNLSFNSIQSTGKVSELNTYQAPNFLRFKEFLDDPSTASPYHPEDGLNVRGASWSFLRYIVDRQPGGHAQFLRKIVSAPAIGITNLSSAIGGDATFSDWLTDWSVAVYADDRVANSSDRHRLRSWNHPSMYNALPNPPPSYPIRTFSLPSGAIHNQQLAGGGSVYFRLGVEEDTVGRVRVTPAAGGIAPPSTLRLTLLRTR